MSNLNRRVAMLVTCAFVPFVTLFALSEMLRVLLPAVQLFSTIAHGYAQVASSPSEASYNAPPETAINNFLSGERSKGVYGFIFNTSQTPSELPFSTYNWCNMPHVRRQEYAKPPADFQLKYVELIHRHHKRTPYASNVFPFETQEWDCSDVELYHYGKPLIPSGNKSIPTYRKSYQSEVNPFVPAGFPPHTCEFPQVTKEGLDDSFQHGRDLYGVYHDLLGLMPSNPSPSKVVFRVTNNVITSQVAGMLISGMYGGSASFSLLVQAPDVDSLEPTYTCPSASALYSRYGPGSTSPAWTAHLTASSALFARLDAISGIDPSDSEWHKSFDHYFDNLSSRLCHQHALPCNKTFNPERCVTQADADEVFRKGEYEYAFLYRRAGPWTLDAAKSSFGVWIAELARHLRDVSQGTNSVVYRHNIAHDGSVSRLLSILQIKEMVWPGMGAEVVFELYVKGGTEFVRILWSGQVLQSSSATLTGDGNGMIPLQRLLMYFDALVGIDAALVPDVCNL